jgi:hypothetical protein
MSRPFSSKRPVGPLADMADRDGATLNIIMDYGNEIPEGKREEAKDNVIGHFLANEISVDDIRVGPDNVNNSIIVEEGSGSFEMDNLQSAVRATVEGMEGSNIKVDEDPRVEVIIDK